jgi:hypothetical protein
MKAIAITIAWYGNGLFYAHIPARFGVINPDSVDPPVVAFEEPTDSR